MMMKKITITIYTIHKLEIILKEKKKKQKKYKDIQRKERKVKYFEIRWNGEFEMKRIE